ncbi:MAG: hypothetical protein WAV79_05025 [Anaerolineae bacterium]
MTIEPQDSQKAQEAERPVAQANGLHMLTGYVGDKVSCNAEDASVLLALAQSSTDREQLLKRDRPNFRDLEDNFLRVALTDEERLTVTYRGDGMFCWLVRGFRRYSPSPPAISAFMPTPIGAAVAPVSLTWLTLPWNDGITIVAGFGSPGGEQVLSLVDDLYATFKRGETEDNLIQQGLDWWHSQPNVNRQVAACAVLVTRRALKQWQQDVQTERGAQARKTQPFNNTYIDKEATDGRV